MKKQIGKSYIEYSEDCLNNQELCIDMLYVNPEDRGNKLGYELLDIAVEYAKENGYKQVGLCAYPQEENGISEEALIDYYRGYGFESDCDATEIMCINL